MPEGHEGMKKAVVNNQVADGPAVDIKLLVAEHLQKVYAYAYRLTGTVADAEDLTQQVFLLAQQRLDQLRRPEAARSWLYAIVRNCFRKQCRKDSPLNLGDLDVEFMGEQNGRDDEIDRELLQAALDRLPPQYRIVVTMFYFEDHTYREIAEALDLPIGTVMSRLARAKRRLRARLFPSECPEAAG